MAPVSRVTDLRHLLTDDGAIASSVHKLGSWLVSIVESVTAAGGTEEWQPLPICCAECPPERGRRGIVARLMADASITYSCPDCSSCGVITNWAKTAFDLRDADDHDADSAQALVYVRFDELDAVRSVVHVPVLRLALAMAMANRDHAVLALSPRELNGLIDEVRAALTRMRGAVRMAAERFVGRADCTLLATQHTVRAETSELH